MNQSPICHRWSALTALRDAAFSISSFLICLSSIWVLTGGNAFAQGNSSNPIELGNKNVKLYLGGAIRFTALTASARGLPTATPFYLSPKLDGQQSTVSLDARNSSLYFRLIGPKVAGMNSGGMIIGQFSNGNVLSGQYGFTPGIAFAELYNDQWRFAFGAQADLFSPRAPVMVDTFSILGGSGNPGNSFRTEIRAERTIADVRHDEKWKIGVALSSPQSLTIKPDAARVLEATGLPNAEGAILWTIGANEAEKPSIWLKRPRLEIGISGVSGEYRTVSSIGAFQPFKTRFNGMALETGLRFGKRFGIQGEWYRGKGLGAYLGNAIQTTNATDAVVSGEGWWADVAYYWKPNVHSHTGYGSDHLDRNRLTTGQISRNATAFLNVIWDYDAVWQFSSELTWRKTEYVSLTNNQGAGLMFAIQMKF
jgi:hypothetical protein